MSTPVFESITRWLRDQGVPFRHVQHAPTLTSEASAAARGEELRVGGKALLIKVAEEFRLFVLSAACKLDSEAIKSHFGVKKTRFATPDELLTLTGLVPGSVPPLGHPILPFALFVDDSIVANERIAFNAGSLTDSLVMGVADYLHVAQPTRLRFAAK